MHPANIDKESVRQLIDRQAEAHPDSVFLLDPQSQLEISYNQLQRQVRAIAQNIASKGLPQGASVAYAMRNGHCCAITLLGIMYGGYRAVAINLVAGRDIIAYVLAHSQTRLIMTLSEHLSSIEDAVQCEAFVNEGATSAESSAKSSVKPPAKSSTNSPARSDEISVTNGPTVQCLDTQCIEQWVRDKSSSPLHPVHSDDDALLMYTSGTTGKPKGVTLSHSNVIAGGRNVAAGHELSSQDRALCVLPLYHINGLCVTLFGPLVASGSLVIPRRFSTTAFWQLVDDYKCSWLSVVPTQIAYLLRDADNSEGTKKPRPHLRFARSASAPLSPDVHRSFEQRFNIPLIETMGLTETAAQILTNPLPPAARKPGSPGLPIGDEVIVADEFQQALGADQEGELLVRGANVMQRYFRNEPATTQALVAGGWLRTGDLGRKDKDGYLYITGRLKELIIKGGENIAPREIDDALYQHADVVEAAAFACPCDDFGQRVEAAVVLKQSSTLSEADLLATCTESVGRFKCPDRIHFFQELPKGPSGKIQRARISELTGSPAN